MPTLFKRSNGVYYIVYTDPEGRRKWVSTHERRNNLALKRLLDFNSKQGEHLSKTSLRKFMTEFLSFAQTVYSSGTVGIYRKSLNRFAELVGDISLSSITPKHIDMFKKHRLGQICPVTLNIELRTLRAAFFAALRWKAIGENPFCRVPLCKIDQEAPFFFTLSEFHKLVSAVKEKWLENVILVAALTGLRRGEIVNLRWSDVDLKKKVLIVQSHEKFRAKSGKRRIVPLSKYVLSVLEGLAGEEKTEEYEYVFAVGGQKISERWLTRKFKRYVRRLGLNNKLHFHSLRHSFATWLMQDGASIYEVQKLLGHSSIRTTEIYSHLASEELHRTVDRIVLPLN